MAVALTMMWVFVSGLRNVDVLRCFLPLSKVTFNFKDTAEKWKRLKVITSHTTNQTIPMNFHIYRWNAVSRASLWMPGCWPPINPKPLNHLSQLKSTTFTYALYFRVCILFILGLLDTYWPQQLHFVAGICLYKAHWMYVQSHMKKQNKESLCAFIFDFTFRLWL